MIREDTNIICRKKVLNNNNNNTNNNNNNNTNSINNNNNREIESILSIEKSTNSNDKEEYYINTSNQI